MDSKKSLNSGSDDEEELSCLTLPQDSNEDSNNEDSLNDLDDPDPLSDVGQYIQDIRNFPPDISSLCTLTEHLDNIGLGQLSYLLIKLGLEFNPDSENLHDYLIRYPEYHNPTLLLYLKNFIFIKQEYIHSHNIQKQQLVPTSSGQDIPWEALLQNNLTVTSTIPSFPDTIFMVTDGPEFRIFRKFYTEPFSLYKLRTRFTIFDKFQKLQFFISCIDEEPRMTYDLNQGSQIQYTFNTLNQTQWIIGLKGTITQLGSRIRILEMRLEQASSVLIESPIIRKLSPTLPITASMVIKKIDLPYYQKSIKSLEKQVDYINIYLSNLEIPEYLKKLTKNNNNINIKSGNDGDKGQFAWTKEIQGYHFLVAPHLIYDEDYTAWMISKIQQYKHLSVIGLSSTHIPTKNYKTFFKSKQNSTETGISKQDIRAHLLGTETLSYFTGTINLKYNDYPNKYPKNNINDLWCGVVAQKQQVSLICSERLKPLVFINKNDNGNCNRNDNGNCENDRNIDDIGPEVKKIKYIDKYDTIDESDKQIIEEIVKSQMPWQYF